MQPFRAATGGFVDRSKPVSFRFGGRTFSGFAGDTLASALLANGVHMVGRSFKYHRPRGIFGAGSEDPAGLVQLGNARDRTEPNTRATEIEIYEGLVANPQNAWPSLAFDVGALNDLAWLWLPAGFYYKTFMGPPFKWMSFEPAIRRAAGLGKAPEAPDPDHYESVNRHVDVLVVGGGPSGLMAALTAGRSGARVMLAEETALLGGRLLSDDASAETQEWIASAEAELAAMPEVTVLKRACAFGYYADNFVGVAEALQDHLPIEKRDPRQPRQKLWRVRAKQVVLATGAIERPLVFHQNDRPGILSASAGLTYLRRYGVLPGRKVAIFTSNNSAYQTAFALQEAGVEVEVIVDLRPAPEAALLKEAARFNIAVHPNSGIVGTTGKNRISSVTIRRLDGQGGVTGAATTHACDTLLVSGGWNPNIALFSQSRGKLKFDAALGAYKPGQSWQQERSAGSANGKMATAECLAEGAKAGAEAAKAAGFDANPADIPNLVSGQPVYDAITVWQVPSGRPKHQTRAFVDLQNDVQAKDLQLAAQEGFSSVEHAKRYTTTGMGTDQGKTVNANAFGILSEATGKPIPEVNVTTFRQPFKPITFGTLAGQHGGKLYAPRRTTPMHDWHVENGAIFEPVGEWLRAQTYLQPGENFYRAVQREALASRQKIGVLDASTLGKIDIRGRDAREFLNRVYSNAWKKLAPGRARYGLMLKEDGMIFDDGVTACLDDNHFHMTTTTGGAARVLGWLEEYLQTEWTDLEVYVTSVTEQWAVASISGPDAGKLVADLVSGIDFDPDKFPFMAWKDGTFDGLPVRVYRVSFTGALAYEINIPASYGLTLWKAIFEAGKKYGATAYGTEAMHLLRAEKGFIIVGQDTDGTITPFDLRMGGMVKKDADFIGRRSLSRSDTARTDRKQLVGLMPLDGDVVPKEGDHIIATSEEPDQKPTPVLGFVTSSYYSPNLKRSIALALVKSGGERIGETVYVAPRSGPTIPAKVTETDFLKIAGIES